MQRKGAIIMKKHLCFTDLVKFIFTNCVNYFRDIQHKKRDGFIAIVLAIVFMIPVIDRISREEIILAFPQTQQRKVVCGEGWIDQSAGENYRWIKKTSHMEVILENQKKMYISGYIPPNIEELTFFSVTMNGSEVYRKEVHPGDSIYAEIPIRRYIRTNQNNEFTMELDGERVPSIDDPDQRVFSALIGEIRFK